MKYAAARPSPIRPARPRARLRALSAAVRAALVIVIYVAVDAGVWARARLIARGQLAQVLGGVDALELEVMFEHLVDQLGESRLRLPAQRSFRFGRVAAQLVDLGRAQISLVTHHVLVPVEAGGPKGGLHELAHRAHVACRDHVIVRLVLLEHQPHSLDVVTGVAPVAFGVEVSEPELVGLAGEDLPDASRDFACDEVLAPAG